MVSTFELALLGILRGHRSSTRSPSVGGAPLSSLSQGGEALSLRLLRLQMEAQPATSTGSTRRQRLGARLAKTVRTSGLSDLGLGGTHAAA